MSKKRKSGAPLKNLERTRAGRPPLASLTSSILTREERGRRATTAASGEVQERMINNGRTRDRCGTVAPSEESLRFLGTTVPTIYKRNKTDSSGTAGVAEVRNGKPERGRSSHPRGPLHRSGGA